MPSYREEARMIDLVFWAPVMAGGALAGASSGVLGTFIVGMRIPFLGVCVAHAALAGAVFGGLCGLEGQQLLLPALAGAMLTALTLGLMNPRRAQLDDNTVLSFLFSATMGLAFLGIGLYSIVGKSDNDVRSLLWGSLNFCRWRDGWFMLGTSLALFAYSAVFFKELRAILFSRADAEAAALAARHAGASGGTFSTVKNQGLPRSKPMSRLAPLLEPAAVTGRPQHE